MRTNKQLKIDRVSEKLSVLGLSSRDTYRLSKRVVESKIYETMLGLKIIANSVSDCFALHDDFAWRIVNNDDIVFYGPKGWASVSRVMGDVCCAYRYNETDGLLSHYDFETFTRNHKSFAWIQCKKDYELYEAVTIIPVAA